VVLARLSAAELDVQILIRLPQGSLNVARLISARSCGRRSFIIWNVELSDEMFAMSAIARATLACSVKLLYRSRAIVESVAMTAKTTSNSMSVNPWALPVHRSRRPNRRAADAIAMTHRGKPRAMQKSTGKHVDKGSSRRFVTT
jgi:hypothetical protein